MNNNKWIKSWLFMVVLIFSMVASLNYIVDPFEVFNTSIFKHKHQPNERFAKIEFLDENNKKFNGYMFGSSRIGTTYPSSIEKYIPDSKIYNLTMSSANLYDYMKNLKYFIKNKYPIDIVYLQLDIENMAQYGKSDAVFYKKLHPYVLDESLTWFYMQHLIGLFPLNIKGKINKNLHFDSDNRTENLPDLGMWTKPGKEKRIIADCESYVKNEPEFHLDYKRNIRYTTSNNTYNTLSKIKKLCQDNGIKLHIFITPHNKNMMDTFVIEDYLRYLKDISRVVSFYDFSGYNSVTKNNCNYYESSHYRPHVGEMIAARIFNDSSISVPDDFGVFVDQNNVDTHLNKLREGIAAYSFNKKQ